MTSGSYQRTKEHGGKISETQKQLYKEGKRKPTRYWLGKKFSEEHKIIKVNNIKAKGSA